MNSLFLIQLELCVLVIFLCKATPPNYWNKTSATDHAHGPVCQYKKVTVGWLIPVSHRVGAQTQEDPRLGAGLIHRHGVRGAPEQPACRYTWLGFLKLVVSEQLAVLHAGFQPKCWHSRNQVEVVSPVHSQVQDSCTVTFIPSRDPTSRGGDAALTS